MLERALNAIPCICDVSQVMNCVASTPMCKVLSVVTSPLTCTVALRCRKTESCYMWLRWCGELAAWLVNWRQPAACRSKHSQNQYRSISGLPLTALTQQLSRSQAILVNQRPRRSHHFHNQYYSISGWPLAHNIVCQSAACRSHYYHKLY